jgi:hypothetical protein
MTTSEAKNSQVPPPTPPFHPREDNGVNSSQWLIIRLHGKLNTPTQYFNGFIYGNSLSPIGETSILEASVI